MKVKTLITLAVGKDKEIPLGSECELEAKETLRLSQLGFVQIIKSAKNEKDRKMVLPLEKAVNSLFIRMGRTGFYQNRKVLFHLSAPDEVVSVGFARAQTATAKLQIRISDAPELKIGEEINVENKVFCIISEPMKDIHNLIWTADLACG